MFEGLLDVSIRKYYSRKDDGDLTIYEISEDNISILCDILPKCFLHCYVSEDKIKEGLQCGYTRESVIETYIPSSPQIKSGEFGEIISLHIMNDTYSKTHPLAPLKWRYKEDKNTPSHKTDFILICNENNCDFIVAAECKTKATYQTKNPIIEAIKGMKKDAMSRLSDTLIWLKYKAIQSGNKEVLDRLNKLLDPVTQGSYPKQFKAIAIIDKKLFSLPLHNNDDVKELDFNYEIIAIIVPNLKENYEKIFSKILEC